MIKYSFLVLPIEKLLERAGNTETYQIRCLILFSIQWMLASIIFSGYQLFFLEPTILCFNTSTKLFACPEADACSDLYFHRFDPDSPRSLISEFDLICDRKFYLQLCNIAFYVGAFVGAYYYTHILQRKGRLFAITQSTSLIGIVLLASMMSIHIYINIAVLFMVGFALFGFLNASVTYFVEVSGASFRILGPNCFLMGWALGHIILAIFSKYFNGWKVLSCFMGLPMLVTAFFFRFMKESPRFLVTQEKFEEAKVSLRNIAKINGRSLPDFSFESEMRLGLFGDSYMFVQNETKQQSITPAMKKNKSLGTLFRYESLRSATWILLIFWVFLTITNHGNILALNHFNKNIQESLIVNGVIQLFGFLISCYFALNYSRRPVIGFAFLAIGLVYILLFSQGVAPGESDIEQVSGLTILLLIVGRASICVAVGTLYNIVVEIFPTNVRHFSFGLFYILSELALFVLVLLQEYIQPIQIYLALVLGIINIFLVFLTRNVSETLNKKVTDYIREEDDLLLSFELRDRE